MALPHRSRGRIALCLLGLLAVPFITAGALALFRTYSWRETSERLATERRAVAQLASLKEFTAAIIEYRQAAADPNAVEESLKKLEAADDRTAKALAAVQAEWRTIRQALTNSSRKPSAAWIQERFAVLLQHTRDLATASGDDLALNPDFGTIRLQAARRWLIADAIDLSQAAVRAEAAANEKRIGRGDEGRLHRLMGRLGDNEERIGFAEFGSSFIEGGRGTVRAEFLRRVDADVLLDPPLVDAATGPALRKTGQMAVAADFDLFDRLEPTLNDRLAAEAADFNQSWQITLAIVASGLALSVIAALVVFRFLLSLVSPKRSETRDTPREVPAQEVAAGVSSSADAVRRAANDLARGAARQVERFAGAAATLGAMVASLRQAATDADAAEGLARDALDAARRGAEAVDDATGAIRRLREQGQGVGRHLECLTNSSRELEQSAAGVEDLAERLSLAALNASLQTGSADGDFAHEAGQLAERCAESTRKIAALARAIPGEAGVAAAALEGSTRDVNRGERLAEQSARILAEVEEAASRLAALTGQVAEAARQQARGGEELAQSIGELTHGARRCAAGTRDTAQSAGLLASLAADLTAV